MKLQILHKGLILLLFPLLLQGFLLTQLYFSFRESERLSNMEERVSTLIDDADQMISDILLILWNLAEQAKSLSSVQIDKEAMRMRETTIMNRLAQESANDPTMESYLAQVRTLWNDLYAFLEKLEEKTKTMPGGVPTTSSLSQLEALATFGPNALSLVHKVTVVQSFRHKEIQALRAARAETASHRDRIELFIFFSAFAEIALTFILLAYFLKDVTKRLSILVDNAGLIPKGTPLIGRVTGGDELAYLDDVLHDASESLRQAAAHRKAVTEMLAHDLRSPLLSANMSLDVLLSPAPSETKEERDDRVVAVKKNLTHLVGFVEDLLTIDKIESGKLQLSLGAVELRALIAEALDNLTVQARAKHLTLTNDAEAIEIVADKNRLHQVLMNIITNAIKYSPPSGTIKIFTQKEDREVIVSIQDEGPGIPEAKQAELFESFTQVGTTDFITGFGLGLSITKLIIGKHGGRVGVLSSEGKGSTFWFSLPLDDDDEGL